MTDLNAEVAEKAAALIAAIPDKPNTRRGGYGDKVRANEYIYMVRVEPYLVDELRAALAAVAEGGR